MLRKYDKYKDSGVEWIGEIPDGWEVKRLKFAVQINPEILLENTDENFEIQYIDIGNVEQGRLRLPPEELKFSAAPSRARRIIKQGDTIVSTVRTYLKAITYINDDICNLVCSTGFAVLRTKFELNGKYIFYVASSVQIIEEICSLSVGVSYPAINPSVLGNISIWLPSLSEQTAIASFLDRKTAEIDQLIARKEKLIALYEEEKTAIINHAVTKGISKMSCPNDSIGHPALESGFPITPSGMTDKGTKPSGIEWLGDIPEHWKVKRLKYLVSKVGSGVTPRGGASVYQLEGIPLLRSQNIHFNGLRLDDVAYIPQETHDDMENSKVSSGDVLLNITGASIGRCYFTDDSLGEANVNQHVCIIRPEPAMSTKYLYYLLRSDVGQIQIDIEQTGSGREGLNFESLKNFFLPVPEHSEQTAIVAHIETECSRLDTIIDKFKKQIELFKEYRTVMISEVVTGKIDVRGEVAA